jgi:hypothetical protein
MSGPNAGLAFWYNERMDKRMGWAGLVLVGVGILTVGAIGEEPVHDRTSAAAETPVDLPPIKVGLPKSSAPNRSTSNDVDLCTDLHHFTCSAGKVEDITGTAYPTNEINKAAARAQDKLETEFGPRVKQALEGDPYFRKLALDATRLSGASGLSPESRKKVEDDNLSETILSELVSSTLSPPMYAAPIMVGHTPASARPNPDLMMLMNNGRFRRLKAEAVKFVRDNIVDSKAKARLESVFPDVQNLLAKLLQQWVPGKQGELLAEKVKSITLEGVDCGESRDGEPSNSFHSLLVPNAFFLPAANTFRFCNGFLLQNKSLFSMVNTIAHELAHSIDPCNIAYGPSSYAFKYKHLGKSSADLEAAEDEYPLGGLIKCLRGSDSLTALRYAPPLPGNGGKTGPALPGSSPGPGPGGSFPGGPFPGTYPGGSPPKGDTTRGWMSGVGDYGPRRYDPRTDTSPFCENDQIAEAVADWASAQVLPEFIESKYKDITPDQARLGYSNVFRGMCDYRFPDGIPGGFDYHSPMKVRINKGLLTTPKVRKQMGCPPELAEHTKYCEVTRGNI